ncbi:MAG: hypothetical protein ABEK04_05790 [Candidatus Nanohalobium sp.]
MKNQSRALDVEVTRDKSEIVEEFMGYRDQKVESDADFPASYQSNISGYGDPAEDAFYEAFADSTLRMTITPGSGFETMEDIGKAVNATKDAEVDIRAKVDGIQDHAPVIQTGIEALEDAGFNAYAGIWEEECYGGSISEAIDGVEEDGAKVNIHASDELNDLHPDAYQIEAKYHPETGTIEPSTWIGSTAHGTEEGVEQIDARMEEALDEVGLLE